MTRPEQDPDEIRAHTVALRRLAQGLCGDPAEAEDIVQDVWVRTLSGKTAPPPQGAGILAWMRGFVRNRSRERERAQHRRTGHERAASRPERIDDPGARIALVQDLLREVQALDTIYRDAIARCYLEGMTAPQAAALEGVSEVTIRTRLHRGISQLRERMDGRCGGREGWLPALAPLAWGPPAGAPLGIEQLTGATTLKTATAVSLAMKKKLILAAALLAGAGLTYAVIDTETKTVPSSPQAPTPTEAVAAAPDARETDREATVAMNAPTRKSIAASEQGGPGVDAPAQLRIHGRVETTAGLPVGGAVLQAWFGDHDPDGEQPGTRSGPLGQFSFLIENPPFERAEKLHLNTRAPGFALRTETRAVQRDQGDVEFLVRMTPGIVVHGIVMDEARQPIEGASIETFRPGEQQVRSDADGRFVLADLSAEDDKRVVRARADGYLGGISRIDIDAALENPGSDEPTLFFKLGRGSRVHGIVVDAGGGPIAGARIHLAPPKLSRKVPVTGTGAQATTDEDGSYSIQSVWPGRNLLTVLHDDYAPLLREIMVPQDALLREDATLLPGHRLTGRVRSSAGETIPESEITLVLGDTPIQTFAPDAEGSFDIGSLPAGGFRIAVTGSRHLPRTFDFVEGQLPVSPTDFVLDPAARIAATVVDAQTHQPIPVFVVRFLADGGVNSKGAGKTASAGTPTIGLPAEWYYTGRAIASSDGTWDTGDAPIPEGMVADVEIRAEGYTVARAERLTASHRALPSDRVIALLPGAGVLGRVVAPDGSPVVGASIRCQPASAQPAARTAPGKPASSDTWVEKARSGADGSFTLSNIEPGAIEFHVVDDVFGEYRVTHFVQAQQGPQEVEIVMPLGASLEGIARDASGQPLQKAEIRVRREPPVKGTATRTTFTDATGRFRIDHLGSGPHVVELSRRSVGSKGKLPSPQTAVTVALTEGATASVELQTAGAADVLGTFTLRSATGEVLPSPEWTMLTVVRVGDPSPTDQRPEFIREFLMTPNGEYLLESVPTGAWELEVLYVDKANALNYRARLPIQVPASGAVVADAELREVDDK